MSSQSTEAMKAIQVSALKKQASSNSFFSGLRPYAPNIKMPTMSVGSSSAKPLSAVTVFDKLIELKLITATDGIKGLFAKLTSGQLSTIKPYDITATDVSDATKLGDIRFNLMKEYGPVKLPAGLNPAQDTAIKGLLSGSEGDITKWYDDLVLLYTTAGVPTINNSVDELKTYLLALDAKLKKGGDKGFDNDQINSSKTGPFFIIATRFTNNVVNTYVDGTPIGSKYIIMDGNGKLSDGQKDIDWGVSPSTKLLVFKPSGQWATGGATKSRRRKSRKGTRRSR